jgi:exosortase/archaeosortase family protein
LDFWFAAATCLAILITSLVPHRWGIGLVATTTAAYLLLTHRGDRNLRAGGCVLLAMSTHLVWGPIIFLLVTPEVVQGDAFAVAGILKVLRPDIIWRDTTFYTPDGHGLILIGACSSFQNVSTALLACATVAMLSRTEWRSRDIITIALAALAMVFINTVRLCLIAWSGPLFKYWHDGYGVTIFIFSETVIVLLIAWRGAAAGGHEK